MLLYPLVLLAAVVAAIPPAPVAQMRPRPVSLALTRMFNASGSNIPEHDRARVAHLLAAGKSSATEGKLEKRQNSIDITSVVSPSAASPNSALFYTATVDVGNTPYTLIVDTGSSNTWVGAGKPYVPSSSSQETGSIVQVTYLTGSSFTGMEYTDTVSLSPNLVIEGQSIGVAQTSQGFVGVDGVLGIGPTDLTEGTVIPDGSPVPTVTDNLFSQNLISQKVVSVYFEPTTAEINTNGELTFGGIVETNILPGSELNFVPITSSSPGNRYFAIDEMISYGSMNSTTVLPLSAGIIHSGITLLLLETSAFNTYTTLTGATLDSNTGFLTISKDNYAILESLFFNIGGNMYEFTKDAQTWPRVLNADIGGTSDGIYLIVGDLGNIGGGTIGAINGATFMERFYTVFNSEENQVGFALTAHTFDETNMKDKNGNNP
ncbi:acid protease [Fomitiporia mediterranea MF3/22]|uniref:acid protease n=1 Tax=Fomitiporia mediterranea (strain MF3/22) TaxID=694068 RepID=UPI0004408C1A|nr:acid protease [Fomitiporia mediterranea MF3/22]EJC99838.1 acid protease [Fomitiporia mediterranea MF3/22]